MDDLNDDGLDDDGLDDGLDDGRLDDGRLDDEQCYCEVCLLRLAADMPDYDEPAASRRIAYHAPSHSITPSANRANEAAARTFCAGGVVGSSRVRRSKAAALRVGSSCITHLLWRSGPPR